MGKIDLRDLQDQTEKSKKENERIYKNRLRIEKALLREKAEPIAKKIIDSLSQELKEQARRGNDSAQVLDSSGMDSMLFKEVAGIISIFCWDNGLNAEVKQNRLINPEEGYNCDYLVISWRKTK